MSNETKHTKEPWSVGAQNDALYIIAGEPPAKDNDYPRHDADRVLIAALKGGEFATLSANASRIVACVNACAGIPTESLEKTKIKEETLALIDAGTKELDTMQQRISSLEAQNNELRELIVHANDVLDGICKADKTKPYEYGKGAAAKNNQGDLPGAGKRWLTPGEAANNAMILIADCKALSGGG